MNPGLVVKLRPAGPWRIGPDSGARNRVDFIYHSDSLYSAVVSAMARLGSLDAWLDATARRAEDAPPPAVCFSSCFPFLDDIGFVVPPRTVWPPVSRALKSARVRWKSARFVPLGVVQAILAGQRLDENHWSVDGPSECLVPAGKPGPFRTAVRWSAAVDRLTGSTERHSTACLEFRPGAGLWTVVSFLDEAAYSRWLEPVKAAFRLLADTGFGGERSRGWGRAESPEFIEGALPDMILPPSAAVEQVSAQAEEQTSTGDPEPTVPVTEPPADSPPSNDPDPAVPVTEPPVERPSVEEPPVEEPREAPSEPSHQAAAVRGPSDLEPLMADSSPLPPSEVEPPSGESVPLVVDDAPSAPEPMQPISDPAQADSPESTDAVPMPQEQSASAIMHEASITEAAQDADELAAAHSEEEIATESVATEAPQAEAPQATAAVSAPQTPAVPGHPHWLLSFFTPAPADAVDWRRGNYTVLARGGRVDSPAGSGELKKQIQMVAEGSVVYAPNGPCGSVADVAPDGFAHPVFRAGFAVSIPLPEVS